MNAIPSRFEFETTCLNAIGADINAMTNLARKINFAKMMELVGEPFVRAQHELGYDVRGMRGGLRMSKDHAVGYFVSRYRGAGCVYFVWSHIEHIFVARPGR